MGSEDGDDHENYPDGEEEGELDAMMGELTNDELKAAFRYKYTIQWKRSKNFLFLS